MTEQWKPIPGHSGYEASSEGRIRSTNRAKERGGIVHPRVLKPAKNQGTKYWYLSLGRGRTRTVHRLVLYAFHGPPAEPGMMGRHLDGDRDNNNVENLAWGTRADNIRDSIRLGELAVGERSPKAKITAADVRAIRAKTTWARGDVLAIARRLGVTPGCITNAKNRHSWKHIA